MIQRQPYGLNMQTNILIDLDIIIDVFLERVGFKSSSDIIQLGEQETYDLYISAHIVSTFAYLLENAKVPRLEILKHITWLLQVFNIVAIDNVLIPKALKSNIVDFKDALIEQAALTSACQTIITRNTKAFKLSIVRSSTPENFLVEA